MECLAATAILVALFAAVLAVILNQRRSRDGERVAEHLGREVAALRAVVGRLEGRIVELEREAGISTVAGVKAEAAPAPEPPPVPVGVTAQVGETEPPVDLSQTMAFPPDPRAAEPPMLPPPPPSPARRLEDRLRALAGPAVQAPRPAASLEERLGARLPVWIGSIALALAGAFLVKYSFEQGWLSPAIRVFFGVMFGIVLLAVGERLRRPSPGIAQGLAAAGIADLFACFLAAVHLYGLISPGVGFAFMALTAVAAVLLSLRHGMMVALIGLIGGFLTPALIRVGEPDARSLFSYLFLLVAGLLAVSWRRGWNPVAAAALIGGLFWVLAWLGDPFRPGDGPWLSLFLLASAGAAVAADLGRKEEDDGTGKRTPPWLAQAMVAGGFLAMALVAGRSEYATTEWAFLGLLTAGTLVLARIHPAFENLAWVAAATPALALAVWGWDVEGPETGRFLATALAFGALLAGGGYLAHRGARHPGRWAALSAASGVVFFGIAWASTATETDLPWGALALGIGIVYLAAVVPAARLWRSRPEAAPALAAFAAAVTTFVSLAVPLELERQWVTVGWAIEVAALVWLAGRFRLPVLAGLARLLALGVAVRLLVNPLVFTYPIGTHLLFNWLVYGYGVPLAAFAYAALLARRQDNRRLAGQLEWGALLFGFALVTLLVRQFFHPGKPGAPEIDLLEWSTLAIAWLNLGWGLLAANREHGERFASVELAGRIFLFLGAGFELLGPVLALNPLWSGDLVGGVPIFNRLLWIYGVPALLLGLGARELRLRESGRLAGVLAGGALLLAFVLISLEVRQAFHGTALEGPTSAAERYAYSAAWLLYAGGLLVAGVLRRGRALRYASLAVMMLTVGKVFLYDTANLTGLYRVFSFLGLGISLLLIAWGYQRFVFRETEP